MNTSSQKTLLVIAPEQTASNTCFHLIVAETGECLATHFCTNGSFAYYDLYERRPDRIQEWAKRFGEFTVDFIENTNISETELHRRNKEWYRVKSEEVEHV